MIPMLSALEIAAALIAAAPPAVAPFGAPMPIARPLVPFAKTAEVDCDWMMHDPREKWIRGSIGHGDGEPVMSLVDSVFYSWSDSEDHAIEISAGDPARRAPASAWAGNAGGQTPGSIGFRMNAELRQLIGGATSLQIWKDGNPVLNAVLAATPSKAELDACVGPPESESTDVE